MIFTKENEGELQKILYKTNIHDSHLEINEFDIESLSLRATATNFEYKSIVKMYFKDVKSFHIEKGNFEFNMPNTVLGISLGDDYPNEATPDKDSICVSIEMIRLDKVYISARMVEIIIQQL